MIHDKSLDYSNPSRLIFPSNFITLLEVLMHCIVVIALILFTGILKADGLSAGQSYRCVDSRGTFNSKAYCRAKRVDGRELVELNGKPSSTWERVTVVGVFDGELRYKGLACGEWFYVAFLTQERLLKPTDPASNPACETHPLVGKLFGKTPIAPISTNPLGENTIVAQTVDRLKHARLSRTTYAWTWPTDSKIITQGYDRSSHPGIDIDGTLTTRNYAVAPGVVVYAGWKNGHGNTVEILHASGHKTLYAHHSRIFVQEGEQVRGGQAIGMTGASGTVRGPYGTHLHFELTYRGQFLDPMVYLPRVSVSR